MKYNYRYEKKWVFNSIDKETLFSNLIFSKLFFKEQFSERTVNSIYFDTLEFKSALDNLAGISDREKYRVRWYGNTLNLFNKPILESKIKKNFQGYKNFFKLDEFNNKNFDSKNLFNLTQKVNDLIPNKNLYPVSMTNYKRMYLISANNEIRATIDYDLQYKKLSNNIENFFLKVEDIVLELKYSANLDAYLRNQISGITRISKNSKYINSLINNNFY